MFQFYDNFDVLSDGIITLKVCEKNPGNEEQVPYYYYDMIENRTNRHAGKISIRVGHNYHSYYNGNIGYEVNETCRGNHYSYNAIMLVLQVARAHDMDFLYITCRDSNIPSRKIIERTGAVLVEAVKIPKDCFFWKENIEDYRVYKLSCGKISE